MFVRKNKEKIGLGYGIAVSLSAIFFAYLFCSSLVSFLPGDYAQRIVPMMIATPVATSIFGIWFLLSKNNFELVIKTAAISVASFLLFAIGYLF